MKFEKDFPVSMNHSNLAKGFKKKKLAFLTFLLLIIVINLTEIFDLLFCNLFFLVINHLLVSTV